MRYLWAFALLPFLGCDEKPKSNNDLAAQSKAKYEAKKSERLKRLEGNLFFFCVFQDNKPAKAVHLRKDCQDHQSEMVDRFPSNSLSYREITLTLKEGKFIDDKGIFYEPNFCEKCVE